MADLHRLVFIDRDGVINVDPIGDYVKRWEDFQFEAGALEALKKISDSKFEIILISNQAGIGDGVYPESALWDIHDKMMKEFKARGILIRSTHYCLHGKAAGCTCRKPEIGLFKDAVKGILYDAKKTYFIGDKATDIEAGKKFGIKTIFVRTGHGKFDEKKFTQRFQPDYRVSTLAEAVSILKL
ncbi:MAG: HAD family hydrolase [Candidatus Omnitrophica bacterium]|nr:HAD family hydrolase [Candidatus Omnitrophota bacterium]